MSSFGKKTIQSLSVNKSSNQNVKAVTKLTPSQLAQKQFSGNLLEDYNQKPKIVKFLNLADYSIYTDTTIPVDETLFEPIPTLIQFTDYEPLQLKEKMFKLRNKDKVARRVKILQPDTRLFQVIPAPSQKQQKQQGNNDPLDKYYVGNKIAPGMEACFIIKFSPEAKIDYYYDLTIVTEREQFVVPIFAIGKRAILDFPDLLDFGSCPVKYVTEKPVIVRNLGEKTAKWFLSLPTDFEADKTEGVLEQGQNQQIVIRFYPKEAKPYKNEAILKYDNLQAYVPIIGSAQNHVVYLSKSFVQMEETYIGLQTQQTLQIINKSAVRVDFEWRAFATEKEEHEKKQRLKQQLEEEENEEKMLLKEIINNEGINEDFDFGNGEDDSDKEDNDEKDIIQKRQKKAELMLARKYKDIRKAIDDDLLLFQDDIFSIEPIKGQIWPNSEITITLSFKPKGAHSYTCPAFCNISCNQDRLPLTQQGEGIGPKAFLNQNEINLGDPFVNEEVRPTIIIENQGEIECKFELLPNDRYFGKMFKFEPENGVLKVGERKEIHVEFSSSKPGEFKETFRWRLEGSSEFLSVLFVGHIRAPQFEFDKEIVDFGKVSYNFPQEERLKLINKSTVPFDYVLRIPGDGKMRDKEFIIDRANGTIQAGETIEITIEFTPRYIKKYEMVLTIDIEGVAQDMKCLPIRAESEVPQVEIRPNDRLDFGEIFLKHRDIMGLQLINNSKQLRAKFEIQEQKKESMILAQYEVEPQTGIIEPQSTATIQVKLITNRLNDITLPLGIIIVGCNNNLPYIINITAISIGPIVEIGGNLKELDFGAVEVLNDYSKKLTITNKSKIEADYRVFTKNKISIFKPIQKYGILKPQESTEVEVVCCADEVSKFQDVLHFVIKDGLDIDIQLKAKGVGTTIYCKDDLTNIDFETMYTHKSYPKEFFVENKGRRPQKLTWVRKQEKKKNEDQQNTKQTQNKEKNKTTTTSLNGEGSNKQQQQVEEQDIFSIIPETVVLPPKHGIMFQFKALSTKIGRFPEQFMLNSQVGNDRKTLCLYNTTLDGEFIRPTLKFSEKRLYFKYTWQKNVPFMAISKNLEITCASILSTNFTLKVQPPFSINKENFMLSFGESAFVKVDFDPGQKTDRVSGQQFGKLQIIHVEHPHREFIELVGEVCFPNIKLEQTTVNFGAILNETSKKIKVNMQNVSEMPINYDWTFLEEEYVNANNTQNNQQRKKMQINEVFDILPLSGSLNPGETEDVEFVYNAFGGQKMKTTAVCHVDGGPNYEVILIGDSSLISYRVSTRNIDFGEVKFCEWASRDFFIENNSKVCFDYKVLYDKIKRKDYIECSPQFGRIQGGEKQRIHIKICPVMPAEFKEVIQVQVSYFEPENITVYGKGIYPAIFIDLERTDNEEFQTRYNAEYEKKKLERENMLKQAASLEKQAQDSGEEYISNLNIKSLDQIQKEIMRDLDKEFFCRMIEEKFQQQLLQQQQQPQEVLQEQENSVTKLKNTTTHVNVENSLYSQIFLANFICDLGNVVLNSTKKKEIKITNTSNQPIDITIDTKQARLAGYTIPERPPKVQPGNDLVLKIVYQTKNKTKYGKSKCVVPIEVKNGARYNIEFISNITIPEIKIENVVDDCLDFGKVICGQRKTVYFRFVNEKEIPCVWSLNTRADLTQTDKNKDEKKFIISPTSGTIQSGQKQLLNITFDPTQEKLYNQKFTINIVDNHKSFVFYTKGQGTQINLDVLPNNLSIGPVLPYEQQAYAVVEVKNNSEYDAEFYSLDFDKRYLEEEETLQKYQVFNTQEQVFASVRQPGDPLQDFVVKDVEKCQEIQNLEEQIRQNPQNAEQYQKRIDELNAVIPQVEYPKKVTDDKKVHLLFIGHPKSGKTTIVRQLSEIHKRCIITIDECVDNAILNQTEVGIQAQRFLQEKQQQLDLIIAEREKLKKKAGKKAPELDAKWGPINLPIFSFLPEDIIVQCIQEKMQHPTCNAGVIFDQLNSKYASSELMALKCIMRAINDQTLQLIVFQKEVDECGYDVYKLIEWDGMEDVIREEEEAMRQKLLELELEQEKKKNKKNEEKKTNKKTKSSTQQSQGSNAVVKKKKTKKAQDTTQKEELEEQNLFEVFKPYTFQSVEEEQNYNKKLNLLLQFYNNQYKEKIENPPIHDPVQDEGKKEEKKPVKKDAKGRIIPEEIPPPPPPEVIDYTDIIMKGPRQKLVFPLHYNFAQMQRFALQNIPEPYYPDPFSLPVQDPVFHQILTKPQRNIQQKRLGIQQNEALKYFKILTPINNPIRDANYVPSNPNIPKTSQTEINLQTLPENSIQDKENIKFTTNKLKRPVASANIRRRGKQSMEEEEQEKKRLEQELQIQQAQMYSFKQQDLEEKSYRWIIPSKKKLILVIRFFTKQAGIFDGKLEFENYFGAEKYTVEVKGIADYPTISNLQKNIYWQIKKNRPQNPPESYLSKVFVQSENIFDFGPLLIGKNPERKLDPEIRKINSTTFRISNHGKYEAQLSFSLMSNVKTDNEYKKNIFFIEPQTMIIQQNDIPQELRIWAIPDLAQKFKDEVIIMIKDNPMPVILPIQCIGCKPVVDIIEGSPIKFDRKLLNQQSSRELKLKNNGQIPVRWKIQGIELLPKEFSLNNTEGMLKPTQEDTVFIQFKAIQQQKFQHQLTLEVEDCENLNIRQETKVIPLEAEAFDISVELKFPDNNQENMLDFGQLRVGDIRDAYFSVKNIGLYLVQFQFVMRKKMFKDNFKIEPQKVQLNPQQELQIQVRFCSQSEVRLNTNSSTTDIIMEILEGKTLELFKPVPINVKINSVFSKYAITPLKNINFGPIQFNDSKTLTFEIKNEGLFEFQYNIFDFIDQVFLQKLKEDQKKEQDARNQEVIDLAEARNDPKKAKKPPAKKPPAEKQKKRGKNDPPEDLFAVKQWEVQPCKGTIPPDSSKVINIKFNGKGQMIHEQKIAIDVSGRDPKDQPSGILYEVVGESCVPGINCEDFDSIFEEQVIVPSQNSSLNITPMINSNVFYLEEKQFFFGTLIPSQNPDGIFEKFKISNPHKIPCTVKFDVRKRNEKSTEPFAFEIAQKQAKIHPHEYTYVKVFFKPTIMAQYSGIFEAAVEFGEQNPKTHKLLFDLKGEGALPTIKLEKPKEYFNDQTPLLKFPKVRIDKTCILPIVLKNDGKIPATIKWDLISNENFKFLDQNSYTLTPKSYKSFNIEFCPKDQGIKQWQILVQTLLNPYECTKFMIQGEGFYQDIVFEGLPEDLEDEINFGNCIIQDEHKVGFFLKNNKPDHIRFNWNCQGSEDFTFVPRVGHLQAKSSKFITLYFKGKQPTTHKAFNLVLETKHLRQLGPNENLAPNKKEKDIQNLPPPPFVDWDDSMSKTLLVTQREYDYYVKKREEINAKRREEELLLAQGKKGAKKPPEKKKKGEENKEDKPPTRLPDEEANIEYNEPIDEPENIQIDKTDKNVPLKVSAICDFSKYEISSREILFKPTLMYTSRTHQFKVKNTSLIPFNYTCTIIRYDEETNEPLIDPGFFYINPKQGTIGPSCDEQFTVKFSPTEVFDKNERFLIISIENLDKNLEPLVISLEGETERPICHFELQPSNYREKKPELDKSFNIIEFESLGTKVKNTKKFYVVNPTACGYEFEWKKIEEHKIPAGANIQFDNFFKCQTQKGVILSGKKFEMIFEYTPDSVGVHESYWCFEIPTQKIVQNFLVVGTVNEPNIFFDVGKVNFGPLLLGGKNKEIVHIKNLESVPIHFNFDKDSIKGEAEYSDSLQVTPMQGVINAQSDLEVEICFIPKVETSYNYNIQCHLKRKSRPISLNVKGIGYILHHSVYLQQYPTTPLDPEMQHIVNLGEMYVNEKRSKIIEIENSGEFNFDFSIKKLTHLPFIQITPENGTVKQNERFQIEVKFSPLSETKLTFKQSFVLNISSGPSYTFRLQANAKKPGVEFSFLSYDFGPQYVFRQPLSITAFLEVKNKDISAMSIETQSFEKTNYLDVNLPPGQVILPLNVETYKDKKGQVQIKESNILKIPIIFTPRESKRYEETITFNINGLHTIDVHIYGEGVPLKLELENTQDQNIDFGVVRVKNESVKIVKVSNQSRKPITITFDVDDQIQELAKSYIYISPNNDLQILPKEIKDIEITFHPEIRLHQFKKEIFYKIVENQEKKKLLNLTALCHGVELKLLEDTIGFGVVVINSVKTKVIQLSNLGDIGTKFDWDFQFCKNYFSISPEKGFLPPHEDIFFTITFHPNVIDNDIHFSKVKCNIDGSQPLYINLLGKCIPQPKEQIQDLKFSTIVRTAAKQKVIVKNPINEHCRIKVSINFNNPNIKGYFSGKELLEIPPLGSSEYEITYYPLTMTANQEVPQIKETQHEATLFFPLPDGNALLYNLFGQSLVPNPLQVFDIITKAKRSFMQIIPIKNWLKVTQRFSVSWVLDNQDSSIFISGANIYDVPGETTKEYKLNLYCLKQLQTKVTIYFKNIETNEYIHFKINLNVQPADIIEKIEMSAFIRETTSKLITIINPLSVPVQITKEMLTSDNDNITFNPSSFKIPPNSEFGFEIIYRPLLVKEEQSKVTLNSPELGQSVYQLVLKGVALSTIQRSLVMKSYLGSDTILSFKFINYCKKQTTYTCKVDKLGRTAPVDPKAKQPPIQVDFYIEQPQPTIIAPPCDNPDGNELGINIRYEPSVLGESNAILIINSPDGGEYTCMLNGFSQAPQPKGPFKITGPKPPPIEFKNPFFEPCEFTIRVDNTNFVLSAKNPVKIDAKKTISLNIQYKPVAGNTPNGRLTIQAEKFDYPPWVFYLSGE